MATDSNPYLWGSDYCFGCGLGAMEDTKHVIMQCPSTQDVKTETSSMEKNTIRLLEYP